MHEFCLMYKTEKLNFTALCLLLSVGVRGVPLSDFYPFGSAVGDSSLKRGDDNVSPAILPHQGFVFFDTFFTIFLVGQNGIIFPSRSLNYTADESISPYFSDVDTRPAHSGVVWHRLTTNLDELQQALSDIQRAFPSVSTMEYLLIVTWDHVRHFRQKTNDKTNTFQCVVAVSGNETYALFLYADGLMQWGDVKSSVAAGIGYTSREHNNISFDLIGSQLKDFHRITFTTNVEVPGMWVFRLDKEELVLPENETCDTVLSLINLTRCSDTWSQPSFTCVHRYGSCVPFHPMGSITFCDGIYEPGVDYVFVPSNVRGGSLEQLIKTLEKYELLALSLDKCRKPLMRIFCHYYYPPCGTAKHFHAPSAVYPDQCRAISELLCPAEWAEVLQTFTTTDHLMGLHPIECNSTGEYLAPLPYCYTELPLNISGLAPSPDCCGEPGTNTSTTESRSGLTAVYVTVAAVLAIALVVVIILLLSLFVKKWRQKSQSSQNTIKAITTGAAEKNSNRYCSTGSSYISKDPEMPVILSELSRRMTENKLLVLEEDINTLGVVGEGEFGIVYRAILQDKRESSCDIVAVKTLKGRFSASDLQSLVEESQIMARFDHPNIMKLLGVTITKNKSFIIMPFMAQGSLLSYLRKHRADLTIHNAELTEMIEETSTKLLSMCLQIARGMEYLAKNKFVHRDLAARNCMIDTQNVIKVADFGLSEEIYARNYFRQSAGEEEDGEVPMKLPVKWMALESLHDGIFSEKTDVWSFGVTCWEVFSLGKNPYPGVDPFSLIRYLEAGERLDKPLNKACSQEIYGMIRECWDGEPEKRPTFSRLVTDISTRLEEMCQYLDLSSTSTSLTTQT